MNWGSVSIETLDDKEITIDFVDDKHGERFVVWVDGEVKKIAKQFGTVDKFLVESLGVE